MSNVKKRCANCRWLLRQDEGYSNWTVMDTVWHCLLGANPHFPVSEPWRDEDTFDPNLFAETCKDHEFGEGVSLDVDREDCKFDETGKIIAFDAYCGADKEQANLLLALEF